MQTAELEIIIPIYNRGEAIIPTLQSLLLQTKDEFSSHSYLTGQMPWRTRPSTVITAIVRIISIPCRIEALARRGIQD